MISRLMHKYNAHAATDITGFGLLGHAQALARNQKAEVCTSRSSVLYTASLGTKIKEELILILDHFLESTTS